jgi:CRP/FNR family transcriptional regulator
MAAFSGLHGFRVLPEAERAVLDRSTRRVDVQRGQMLFAEGGAADTVWAVAEGKVHIVKSGPEGREIVLEVVAPGELFGAIVAIEDRPYPASAIAAEAGGVWCLPATLVRDFCRRYPTLRNAILGHVAERLRSAHERLRSVALERAEQRLARALLALAKKIGSDHDGRTALNVTRQELADMTGTTVETAIRVTSRWQGAGLIATWRSHIEIVDAQGLAAIAYGESSEPPL